MNRGGGGGIGFGYSNKGPVECFEKGLTGGTVCFSGLAKALALCSLALLQENELTAPPKLGASLWCSCAACLWAGQSPGPGLR